MTNEEPNAQKNVSLNVSLSTTNPEVFTTSPRRGGYVKQCPNEIKAESSNICKSDTNTCAVQTTISTGCPNQDLFVSEPYPEEKESACKISETASEKNDVEEVYIEYSDGEDLQLKGTQMLAITISVVMMMASEEHDDITLEYLEVAQSYLEMIKDDEGKFPPNVEALLSEVKFLKALKTDEPGEEE